MSHCTCLSRASSTSHVPEGSVSIDAYNTSPVKQKRPRFLTLKVLAGSNSSLWSIQKGAGNDPAVVKSIACATPVRSSRSTQLGRISRAIRPRVFAPSGLQIRALDAELPL